jgi:hypothetical protein
MMAKKIVNFYYLKYPDDRPPNPDMAESEVYVEVGDRDTTQEHFDSTYAFHVYTVSYLSQLLRSPGKGFLIDRAVIVVERFEDALIRAAIESIIESIADYGIEK